MYPHSTFKLSVYLLLARVFCAVNAVKINLEGGKKCFNPWDCDMYQIFGEVITWSRSLLFPTYWLVRVSEHLPFFLPSHGLCVCVCVRAGQYIYVPVLGRTAVIFTRYSAVSFIGLFVIRRANQALISYVGVLPSCCDLLCYTLHAELFLQPHFLPHKEHMLSLSERLS